MSIPTGAVWRGPTEGDAVGLLGGLYSYRARGADTDGAYSLFEVEGPVSTPLHMHHGEEEGFYVVAGEVSFQIGDEVVKGGPGTFAFVPRGVNHGFRLDSPDAKLLLLLTPGNAGHEAMFEEMGEPADDHAVPAPPTSPPDLGALGATAARHGTAMVGPPRS